MRRAAGSLWALVVVALICAVAIPAAVASPSERGGGPTVKVGDDFFSTSRLNVKPGTEVKFKWLSGNRNKHNVTLTDGPRGVDGKGFTSKTDKTGVRFSPTFKKAGGYDFLCTIHPGDMQLKVVVKR